MQRSSAAQSSPVRTETDTRQVEDVHLRNHDFTQAYDLTVRIENWRGEAVLDRRFFARPGWSRSLSERLPPGQYDVIVTLDGGTTERERCRIDDDPEHSVLIECGNGCVSVVQGIY